MGSQSTSVLSNSDYAYIAGFLDGDGSLMLQLKKRQDTSKGIRFMATICLYQDTRHAQPFEWMRNVFGIGYITHRSDGISELRINGFKQVATILDKLIPFIKFKIHQAKALRKACGMLQNKHLSRDQLRNVVDLMFLIKKYNYKSHHKQIDRNQLLKLLDLTP